jgi:hypothetical protein
MRVTSRPPNRSSFCAPGAIRKAVFHGRLLGALPCQSGDKRPLRRWDRACRRVRHARLDQPSCSSIGVSNKMATTRRPKGVSLKRAAVEARSCRPTSRAGAKARRVRCGREDEFGGDLGNTVYLRSGNGEMHPMKEAFLAVVVIEMAILNAATIPSLADDLPPLNSLWRETQRGSCFEISQISDPFPGDAGCVQIAGRMNERDLMIGYACKTGSDISFFSGLQTDNSIKPDVFVGRYNSEAISVQYCTRISNDWPPVYNCENSVTFKRVSSCKP